MSKLRAFMTIVAGSVLATGIAALPAQAASAVSSNPPAQYVWFAYAGQGGLMNTNNWTQGAPVFASTHIGDSWEATGCETTSGHVYCHQQILDNHSGDLLNLCLSSHGVALGGQLNLNSCTAEGGGQQVDQLWWFSGQVTNGGTGTLENDGDGDYAISGGYNNEPVDLGTFSGANNNYWVYGPA